MILLLGIQSVSYVRQLSQSSTGTILADNYNSLQYAEEMLRSLNDIARGFRFAARPDRADLALQQQNITEISEREITAALGRQDRGADATRVTEAEIQIDARRPAIGSWS